MSPPPRRKWFALALLCTVQFMVVLDIAIVNVALPSIQTDLGFSPENLQWVISAYALLFGGFLLLGGRAADLLGRRRVFLAGIVVFTAASLLSGLAWSEGALIGARALQGLGAAIISPGRALDPHDDLRRGQRAQQGARRLGRGRRVRRRRRRAARRRAHRPAQLGVDLLRQRPGRRRRLRCSRRCCSRRAATRPRGASTSPAPRSSPAGSSCSSTRSRRRNDYGWGSVETIGFFAAAAALLDRLRRLGGAHARPADAAVDLPPADARGRQRGRADPRHRAVRDVPDADALHAAGARLFAAEDRRRLPRGGGHGDPLVGGGRAARHPRRRQAGARHRHGVPHRRARLLHAGLGRRHLPRRPAARLPRDRGRHGVLVRADLDRRRSPACGRPRRGSPPV